MTTANITPILTQNKDPHQFNMDQIGFSKREKILRALTSDWYFCTPKTNSLNSFLFITAAFDSVKVFDKIDLLTPLIKFRFQSYLGLVDTLQFIHYFNGVISKSFPLKKTLSRDADFLNYCLHFYWTFGTFHQTLWSHYSHPNKVTLLQNQFIVQWHFCMW